MVQEMKVVCPCRCVCVCVCVCVYDRERRTEATAVQSAVRSIYLDATFSPQDTSVSVDYCCYCGYCTDYWLLWLPLPYG